LEIVHVRAL